MAFSPAYPIHISTLAASGSNGAISTNRMPAKTMPAYGMASNTELRNMLHSTIQDPKEKAYFLVHARPANMPKNMPVSDQMRRRLISSMLVDLESQQYEEIITAIFPTKDLNWTFTPIIINMLATLNSNQRKNMIAQMLDEMIRVNNQKEHDQCIRDMLPYLSEDCQSAIIEKMKVDRSSMLKFVLENTDFHDQRCMIETLLPTTSEVMQKNLISSLLANSSKDQRVHMIESVVDAVIRDSTIIKTLCSQAYNNDSLFPSLVASMLANTDHWHYRSMVETLLKTEYNYVFHSTLWKKVFAHLVADVLANDTYFHKRCPQNDGDPDPCEIVHFVLQKRDETSRLCLIGNPDGDYVRGAMIEAIEELRRPGAENNNTT